MKTILCFDSWTKGSRNFARLTSEFKQLGYELLLIHIGSWGHDQARPKEEIIDGLQVRDISYYPNKSFESVLLRENPAAVLFLSTRAFAHMAFNRHARYRNIPTCHLYHGLVKVQAVAAGQITHKINYYQHTRMLLSRAWKNLFRLVPLYIHSLLATKASWRAWVDLFDELSVKTLGKSSERVLLDTQTTLGCVYVQADVEHMVRRYGMSTELIHVVGNPDLAMFGLDPKDAATFVSLTEPGNREIVYIDTAFSKSGLVFATDADFVQHLTTTRESIDLFGYRLVVKLHPAHYHSGCVPQTLQSRGVELCLNHDFVERLKLATAAIAEPSSAAIIPACLGKTLLLARYGKLAQQLYGEVLSSYPRARLLEDLSQIGNVLDEERNSLSVHQVQQWIDENAGPLPAEYMPKRVADAIDQMVRKH